MERRLTWVVWTHRVVVVWVIVVVIVVVIPSPIVVVVVRTPRTIVATPAPPEVTVPATAVAYVPIPVIPRIARITYPRIVPGVKRDRPAAIPGSIDRGCERDRTPRSEHRGDELRLYPYLVARDHNIIEGWVVGCCVGYLVAITQRVVARWHTIATRREASQTTCIGTLVAVGYNTRIWVIVIVGVIIDNDDAVAVDTL
jgi:hypothetical protein